MGKALAVTVLLILLVLVVWLAVTVLCRFANLLLWERAKGQAKWETHTEMSGLYEASVTVRQVATLPWRREVLHAFPPEVVQIAGLGDPKLLEAQGRAEQQASDNNMVGLVGPGRD